jgi:DNA repair exonuclease SbcCD ATPase subunit
MEPKNSKIFNKEMMQTVSAFCESQEIKDIDQFMYLCFKQGFDIKKYGLLGKTLNEGEKEVIKEVIVEKRVEVPVEKVVIQEVIKEIPVDRVVEKEVYITDNTQVNELLLKIQQLENEMSKKNEELDELRRKFSTKEEELNQFRQEFSTKDTENESFFQNEMSKKDEELAELRRTLDELKNNDKLKLLQDTLQNLRTELQEKKQQITELEKINRELLNSNQNQGYLMRGSNLNRRI